MNESRYFEFIIEQYRTSLESAESLYQRYSVLIAAIVAVGAAWYSHTAAALNDNIPCWLLCASILLALIGFVSIVATMYHLLSAMLPRMRFEELSELCEFSKWRTDYTNSLKSSGFERAIVETTVADETCKALTGLLIDAESTNRRTAQYRLRQFNRALKWLVVALIVVAVQTLVSFGLTYASEHQHVEQRPEGSSPSSPAASFERTE